MAYVKVEQNIKNEAAKTKMVWTLGAASRSVEMIEKLLEAGMNIARFDFSEGSHAHHQETINNLRTAIRNTGILCAVMLDTKAIIITAKAAVNLVARCRPSVPVLLVVSMSESFKWSSHVASHGLVFHGIISLMGADSKTIGDMISFGVQVAKKEEICNAGDLVVALRVLNLLQPLHVQ
ncbi:hypothetical protein IGI04_013615 [Brassica rapa subsp. trilocularis]|uniref:pyruvate kinase n=1 Tax=Brassica rapa subsp. trilocularis TaxID=1813537 RepID=A0ABQ7NBH0_BRACM|nr:hypothetical protein IGI04_013615 [Brassica rapa subsp. trilocularis]